MGWWSSSRKMAQYFVAVSFLIISSASYAGVYQAIDWLKLQQAADNSIALDQDIANPRQSTYETLLAFDETSDLTDTVSTNALAYFNSFDADTLGSQDLSRRIILNSKAGLPTSADVALLLQRQNADGGFGQYEGYNSGILSTAFALRALKAVNQTTPAQTGIGYLISQQDVNGDWSVDENDHIQITAHVMSTIWEYRTLFSVESVLDNAQTYLEQQRNTNQLWDETEQSALALIAFVNRVNDRSVYQASIDALSATQNTNGSFEGDVYLTALIARLLAIFEKPSPDLISLSGIAIDAETRLPLQGVAATLTGVATYNLTTDATGAFSFENIDAGVYQLELALTDYGTLVSNVALTLGDKQNLGELALTKQPEGSTGNPPTTGILLGTVTDSNTGLPLENAQVSLIGTAFTATTNVQGQYQINNVTPGALTIQVSLSDFATVSGSGSISAGQTLAFSPTLQPLGDVVAMIQGTVIDQDTGQPVEGATINLNSGTQNIDATTDAAGQYLISDVVPGSATLTASQTGYQTQVGTVTINNSVVVNFSPILVPEGSTDNSVNNSAILGKVVDRQTDSPIQNATVQVTIDGNIQNVTTDANGDFTASSLADGQAAVVISATGYEAISFTVSLPKNTNLNISTIRLLADNATGVYGLQGKVIDARTELPLEGVEVTVSDASITNDPNPFVTTTNAQGEYVVPDAPQSVGLTFTLDGYYTKGYATVFTQDGIRILNDIRLREQEIENFVADLKITGINTDAVQTDPATLQTSGSVNIEFTNQGNSSVTNGFDVIAFYDVDNNSQYDVDTDMVLGSLSIADEITIDTPFEYSIDVSGSLPFRDAPIHVLLDSSQLIVEFDETNNIFSSADECAIDPACQPVQGSELFDPTVKWQWAGNQVVATPMVAQTNDDNNDGEINDQDIPDVIINSSGILRILDGDTGVEIASNTSIIVGAFANFAIADIDADGLVEIVAPTASAGLVAFNHDATVLWSSPGIVSKTIGGAAIADIDADGTPEIVYDRSVINADGTLRWQGTGTFVGRNQLARISDSYGHVADIDDTQPGLEIIFGASAYAADGTLLWQNDTAGDGYTASADFDGDGTPEIVKVFAGSVSMLDAQGNLIWGPIVIPGMGFGGAPTIGDMDGDGEPEIGIGGSSQYTVLEADGSILWQAPIQDFSSAATGSSVFDFNNDGREEVVFMDEVMLRVYDGATGTVVFEQSNSSITAFEYPVVVDLDNDGHAEIIVPGATGIQVLEDVNDNWAATRSIWNQHAYHIDNVNDDGSIPTIPTKSWLTHNTFRLNKLQQCIGETPRPTTIGEPAPEITVTAGYAVEVFASNVTTQQGPNQLAFNSQGDLFIALGDSGVSRIPAGTNVPQGFGSVGVRDSDGVAVDSQDNVIVSGFPVTKFAPDGSLIWQVGCPAGNLQLLSVDANDNVYVGSLGAAICKISPDGQMLDVFGGFSQPSEPSVSPDGFLYLSQYGLANIAIVSLDDFSILDTIGVGFLATQPVFDNNGNLYVGRGVGSTIAEEMVIDLSDNSISTFASGFAFARSRAFSPDGDLYIGDATRKKIYKITFPKPIVIEKADLSVSKLELLASQDGVSARFGNGGSLASTAGIKANVYRNNGSTRELLGAIDLPAIEPGEYVDLQLNNISGLQAGDDIEVIVDEDNELNECREDNNSMSITLAGLLGDIEEMLNDSQFTTNEDVTITRTITNTGTLEADYSVMTVIEDSLGNQVTSFASQDVNDVAASQVNASDVIWNTATSLAGDYVAKSMLYDSAGNMLDEATQSFSIVSDVVQNITLRTTTDKTSYYITDTVEISGLVRNVSDNAVIAGATLQIEVLDSSNAVVFTTQRTLSDLTPSFSDLLLDAYAFENNAEGSYTINASVLAAGGAVLAQDSTGFLIEDNPAVSIVGQVSVANAELEAGESQVCTHTITNNGLQTLSDQAFRQVVVLFETDEEIATSEFNATITSGGQATEIQAVDTNGLAEGNYACILQVNIAGVWQSLAFDNFLLTEPPISIALESAFGDKGRVLVLLDDSSECTDDPHGPRNAPDLIAQQALLESILTNAGWSYTITLNTRDFMQEFRTGGYSNYLLLSELSHIPHYAQKELREAVYRGDGLIEAGKQLYPYTVLNGVLGIDHRGVTQRQNGITLFDSDLHEADSVTFTHRDKNIRIRTDNATAVAEYMNSQQGHGHGHHSNHHRSRSHGWHYFGGYGWHPRPHNSSPAITINEYGLGKSMFVGFDLLLEAASLGTEDNIFTELLLNGLTLVNPKPLANTIGTDVPVTFTIQNEAQATPARLVLPIPEGVSIVDAGEGVIDEATQSVIWTLSLVEAEQQTITVWVEMPAETTTLTASIQSGEEPNYVDQATTSIELLPQAGVNIDELIDTASDSRSLRPVKYKLQLAKHKLEQNKIRHALDAMLLATNHIAYIEKWYSSEELTALRVQIDELIKQTARQLVLNPRQPRHRCRLRGHWHQYHYPRQHKRCGNGHYRNRHGHHGGGYGHGGGHYYDYGRY